MSVFLEFLVRMDGNSFKKSCLSDLCKNIKRILPKSIIRYVKKRGWRGDARGKESALQELA